MVESKIASLEAQIEKIGAEMVALRGKKSVLARELEVAVREEALDTKIRKLEEETGAKVQVMRPAGIHSEEVVNVPK